jgi:hypothetical protein
MFLKLFWNKKPIMLFWRGPYFLERPGEINLYSIHSKLEVALIFYIYFIIDLDIIYV